MKPFKDDKDLIYEGIATGIDFLYSLPSCWRRQRPDLRRDCDIFSVFIVFLLCPADDKDLIYEGIATRRPNWPPNVNSLAGRQRPDLRRDCDSRDDAPFAA